MRGEWSALVVFLLIIAASSSLPVDSFSCPRNCSCSFEGYDEHEISCPREAEHQITVQLSFKRRNIAIIQCQVNTAPDSYALLEEVNIEGVTSLEFRLCPLPDVPFTELLQIRQANKIQTFTFTSYRSFNDTLERKLFQGLTGVATLSLANNGLTALPADVFMDLPHLQELYLLNNHVQLPADIFQPVLSLETLELGKNDLSNLPIDLFRNLKKLQILNLWKNKLSNLSPDMFKDLSGLTILDLRHNGLTSLPFDLFKHLSNLKVLRLNGNNFQTLPEGLFKNNRLLTTVQLSDNREPKLMLPSGLFSNLTNLTAVDLYNNGLKEVPEDLFTGSINLKTISFQNNYLRELPTHLFQTALNLDMVNLAFNHLQSISDNVFGQCKKLRVLDLSYNKIINLTMNSFSGSDVLEEINLQNNMLRHVDIRTFRVDCYLKRLNLANNFLSFLDKEGYTEGSPRLRSEQKSPFENCKYLEKLDLANNSISQIFYDWKILMPNLHVLNLSHNVLQSVEFPQDSFIPPYNREIDIRHNKISVFNLETAERLRIADSRGVGDRKRQKWLVDGNPLACNCSNFHFLRYLEGTIAPEVLSEVEFVPGKLACATPVQWSNEKLGHTPLSKAVTCPLAPTCGNCPISCDCNFRRADTAIVVDCVARNLTVAPAELPSCSDSNHTELYLTKNNLQMLPDFTQPGYNKLSKLAIGQNNITSLRNTTQLPQNVRIIELHQNNMTSIEPEVLTALSNLTNLTAITFHGNPWKCDCHLQPLLSFVQLHYSMVKSSDELRCFDSHQRLLELSPSGLCSQLSSVVWASLVVALFIGGLIGGAFAVYYRFNHEIKAWLFAHNLCLWFVSEEELDKDKLYDAFVSFSHKDHDFVVNELVPALEEGPVPFRLCLHYRDWVAGEWITNQIARSVDESRRTLVVLSPNFLESVWGIAEFRTAHCQALCEGRARVIILLLSDIGPTENLDPELKAYLSMNTYVKWGDPLFWEKLRYALPHPPKAMKGSIGLVNRNGKHMNGKSMDDKTELMCEPAAAVTTPPAENNSTDPLRIKNAHNGAVSSPKKAHISPHKSNGAAAAVA